MKTRIMTAAVAMMAVALQLQAQNVNQTVQVTNDYVSRFSEFEKRALDMNVPDTLLVFDYKFDYSVFDNPYKGAYEFSPYSVRFTPDARNEHLNKLYVNLGAGYNFAPELEVAADFKLKENLQLGAFGTAGGYLGNYRLTRGLPLDFAIDKKSLHSGFDFADNAGVAGRLGTSVGTLGFEAGHNGVYAADLNQGSAYNSAYAKLRFTSDAAMESFFFYDLGASYRFGHNSAYYAPDSRPSMNENDIAFYGTVGPVLDSKYSFLADFHLEQEFSRGVSNTNVTLFKLTPRVAFDLGPVSLSAGAKLDFNSQSSLRIYPDVHASASFFRGYLNLRASLYGDSHINSFHSMKERNHFFVMDWANTVALEAEDAHGPVQISCERLKAELGLSGQARHIYYELSGGWGIMQNQLMDSYFLFAPGRLEDRYALADHNMVYADLRAGWLSERLNVDARASLRHLASLGESTADYFGPSLFGGDIKGTYNWNKRIYASLWLGGSTPRVLRNYPEVLEDSVKLAGWIDLGLGARYVISPRWGVWLKADNLLMQNIRTDVTHVRNSPICSVGVSLTL